MTLNERRRKLELVFDILRFRYRENVTFRKWVILTAGLPDAPAAKPGLARRKQH
jgi:hypothetical protein